MVSVVYAFPNCSVVLPNLSEADLSPCSFLSLWDVYVWFLPTEHITRLDFEEKLKAFTGDIMQVPPLWVKPPVWENAAITVTFVHVKVNRPDHYQSPLIHTQNKSYWLKAIKCTVHMDPPWVFLWHHPQDKLSLLLKCGTTLSGWSSWYLKQSVWFWMIFFSSQSCCLVLSFCLK